MKCFHLKKNLALETASLNDFMNVHVYDKRNRFNKSGSVQ